MARPSAASRWARGGCTGSVALAARYPDTDEEFGAEGTRLHALAAELLREERLERDVVAEDLAIIMPYVRDVQAAVERAGKTRELLIEERREWQPNPTLAGTPDAALKDFQAQRLTVWDFKSGWRLVEAFENHQLLCYAMMLCPPSWNLELRIAQPQPSHPEGRVRSWHLSWQELQPYWVWIGRAVRAITDGKTELKAGGHCIYCPALHACPAARDVSLRTVGLAQREPFELDDAEIGRELEVLREASKLIALRTAALEEDVAVRLREGRLLRGVSMREGRGGRWKWTQDVEATRSLLRMLTGKDHAITHIPTPKQLIDAGVSEELVRSLAQYQPGKMKVSTDVDRLARKVFK